MMGRRTAARVGFGVLGLALLVQTVVWRTDSEPYPALIMPAFDTVPLVDGRFSNTGPSITVVFAGDSREVIQPSDLFPDSGVTIGTEFDSAFGRYQDATDPRTVDWLRHRLSVLFPHREPRVVYIRWYRKTYSLTDRSLLSRHRIKSYRIEVDG
jgi:hypothetical protein